YTSIGMTEQELVDSFQTVVQSGIAKFFKALKVLLLLENDLGLD
ncbi:hypothetical protein A2U01_0079706, partial [Trifolium medium]|nr:hypothetical protein [Trifolium medium]